MYAPCHHDSSVILGECQGEQAKNLGIGPAFTKSCVLKSPVCVYSMEFLANITPALTHKQKLEIKYVPAAPPPCGFLLGQCSSLHVCVLCALAQLYMRFVCSKHQLPVPHKGVALCSESSVAFSAPQRPHDTPCRPTPHTCSCGCPLCSYMSLPYLPDWVGVMYHILRQDGGVDGSGSHDTVSRTLPFSMGAFLPGPQWSQQGQPQGLQPQAEQQRPLLPAAAGQQQQPPQE